ncbi:TonB-dependent receptor plug domain-containing protein [Echinimonas agarilytica]|uniref:TonB-dependent receptor n=1 Tax=Echinimonas agarilytica TaxID=1215918 RepID=A0AA42B7K6_9GAMM|nr:TonB-dependent receptor [Echinimonas agarilytica]MCM2680245.1 TonB-dependent receptor [Echinimonas agarilytica]
MYNVKLKPLAVAIVSAFSISAIALPAAAQDSSDKNVEDVEQISVTGSRIKRTDMETASPVSIITADDISLGSYTSVEQVLQQSTASNGIATGAASNNGGVGAARVNLRGLGSQRTLILVNGRRMVNSGVGADSSVDLNTIPIAAIERIEVLKDGASAVYGSDAIAGVVNIITKSDFEGLELSAGYSGSQEGDGNTGEVSLITGGSSDKGNFVMGMSYVDRGQTKQGDRDFSKCPDNAFGEDGTCQSGSSFIPGGTVNTGDGWKELTPGGDPQNPADWVDQSNYYNYSERSYLYTPQKRVSVFANGQYEVAPDTTMFVETMYTKRTSNQQMAPEPINGLIISGDNAYNPFGEDIEYRRRMTEAGDRAYDQTVDTIRLVAGIEGYLDIGSGYDWDFSYIYGRNDSTDRSDNYINVKKVGDTLDNERCAADPNIPCGDWFVPNGELSQDLVDYVTYTDQASGGNEMNVVNFNISGDAWEMPAGAVGFASGVEYRREKGWYQPDAVTVAGDGSASAQDPTSGSYDTTQVYAEFAVPLLSDMAYAEELTAEFAARWFDYSTFGSDMTWKLGLTWRLNSELMVRGVASTAFRAPTVDELYGGSVGSFDYLADPCSEYGNLDPSTATYKNCHAQIGDTGYKYENSQIENTWLTSDELGPEEADTYTLGVVYSPEFLDGFSATVDYYQMELTNAISRIDTQAYLNNCYAGVESACEVLNLERSEFSGEISYMESPLTNIGNIETSGVDMNFAYGFEWMNLDWSANVDSSYLIEYIEDDIDYTGKISGLNGGWAEWKTNTSLTVGQDAWEASWRYRYIGGMTDDYYEEAYGLRTEVGSVSYHDVSARYYINDTWSVSGGVDNVFDKTPPYLYSYSDANTVPEVYDVMGRYFHAKVTARF